MSTGGNRRGPGVRAAIRARPAKPADDASLLALSGTAFATMFGGRRAGRPRAARPGESTRERPASRPRRRGVAEGIHILSQSANGPLTPIMRGRTLRHLRRHFGNSAHSGATRCAACIAVPPMAPPSW